MSRRLIQAVNSGGLAAILAAYVFLLVPFTLYSGNANEFNVSFGAIFRVFASPMVFVIGAIALIGMLLPGSIYKKYAALLAAIGILFYLQADVLVWDYGRLDGHAIDWSRTSSRGWVDSGVWLAGILLAAFGSRPVRRWITLLAIVLIGLQSGLFAFNWLAHGGDPVRKQTPLRQIESPGEIFRFSAKKNVLHILADGFQSDLFEDIINDGEEGRRIAAMLDGFTFYRNHLGIFPYTHLAVPAILSGKIYQNKRPIDDFLNSAIGGKTIFHLALKAGYDLDLAVPASLTHLYGKSRYTNLFAVPAQIRPSADQFATMDSARLFDLSLFRLSPHWLKKIVYNDQLWLVQSLLTEKDYMGRTFFAHTAFLRDISEHISADRQKPVYKYLHLMLSHKPMVTNRQCEYAGRVLPTVRETVRNQARCGLIEVLNLFTAMKKLGIYDDALIVLMADHGAWVTPSRMTGILSDDGHSMEIMDSEYVALSQPLLLIKKPGQSGPLRISNAPSWIVDTPATIADAMQLEPAFSGSSVFDLREDAKRTRKFFVYQFQRSEWTDQYLPPILEFDITGNGVDSAAWHVVAAHLPNGVEQRGITRTSLQKTINIDE